MWRYFTYEIKKIWQRQEIWIVLIASALIAVVGFFNACNTNSMFIDCGTTLETIYSSEKYTLLDGGGDIGLIVVLCIMPILATIAAGASYGEEKKARLVSVLVSRGKRSAYYIAKVIAIAITAFVCSTLPFLLNGLFAVLAVPIKEVAPLVSFNLYGNNSALYSYETGHMLFPTLYLNFPMLNYLAHLMLIGLYGIGLALLTYGISFFYHKSKVMLILLPMIIHFVIFILQTAFQLVQYNIVSYFLLVPNPALLKAPVAFAILLSFILIDVLLILTGIKRNEDIL